jgi:hypothetical protein
MFIPLQHVLNGMGVFFQKQDSFNIFVKSLNQGETKDKII